MAQRRMQLGSLGQRPQKKIAYLLIYVPTHAAKKTHYSWQQETAGHAKYLRGICRYLRIAPKYLQVSAHLNKKGQPGDPGICRIRQVSTRYRQVSADLFFNITFKFRNSCRKNRSCKNIISFIFSTCQPGHVCWHFLPDQPGNSMIENTLFQFWT